MAISSMICRVMYGNGVPTGTMPIITRKAINKLKTLQGLPMALTPLIRARPNMLSGEVLLCAVMNIAGDIGYLPV